MSDSKIIQFIRQEKALRKLWDAMTIEQRKRVLAEAGNDSWRLDEIVQNVSNEK